MTKKTGNGDNKQAEEIQSLSLLTLYLWHDPETNTSQKPLKTQTRARGGTGNVKVGPKADQAKLQILPCPKTKEQASIPLPIERSLPFVQLPAAQSSKLMRQQSSVPPVPLLLLLNRISRPSWVQNHKATVSVQWPSAPAVFGALKLIFLISLSDSLSSSVLL